VEAEDYPIKSEIGWEFRKGGRRASRPVHWSPQRVAAYNKSEQDQRRPLIPGHGQEPKTKTPPLPMETVPQQIVDQYKEFISKAVEAGDKVRNLIEFGQDESILQGKEALRRAAAQMGKRVIINKEKNQERTIRFCVSK